MLFSFSEYARIGEALGGLPGLELGEFSITRYANQELHAVLQTAVSGRHCFVLGTVAPPEHQMASLSLLAHTLKKEGAERLTGILPYLAYSREDKVKSGESLATAWIGTLLKASAFDEIWTVDLHSEHDKHLFPRALRSFSSSGLFAECLRNHGLTGASVVAPDNGAVPRCEAVRSAAGMTSGDIVYFEKRRTAVGIVHSGPIGKLESTAVVIDDILDTGTTSVSACEKLARAGAQELYIRVTHGLFTGPGWRNLWSLPVKRIFCTDTIPACANIRDPRITTLPIGPWLREKLLSLGPTAESPSVVKNNSA
jgi:ribose-phosphate pyrophosphokinase